MKPKVDIIRAILSVMARRIVILGGTILAVTATTVFAIIWALAYFVSGWWWLLLIIYIPLLLIGLVIFLLARFIATRLYSQTLTKQQKKLLTDFVDKIQRLVEAKGMGWWFFALLNLKDLVFHRDLRTTRDLIRDTTSLKQDFAELEKKL